MTVATASLLGQVAQGAVKKGWHRSSSTAQRLALQTLINQGLVELERNGDVWIAHRPLRLLPRRRGATALNASVGRPTEPTH